MRTIFFTAVILAAVYFASCRSKKQEPEKHPGETVIAASHDSNIVSHKELNRYEVLSMLKDGNRRFVLKLTPGNISHDSSYNYFDQISHTRAEQHPQACILTCMDSRVPPEIIFDQGIGSLFTVRLAGNIEDPDVLGSMEYAVAEKGVQLIVVLGHKNCGAINAAFGKVNPNNKELASLIELVKKDVVPDDKPPYDASAKKNVKITIDNILKHSKSLKEKMQNGQLIIVGALYDVANGTVDWKTENW
jgi:carbonic anhydrase